MEVVNIGVYGDDAVRRVLIPGAIAAQERFQ